MTKDHETYTINSTRSITMPDLAFSYNPILELGEIVSVKKSEYDELIRLRDNPLGIQKIIFNDPVTVVFWNDDTKTVVRNMSGTEFNPYQGFCAAVAKKMIGNNHNHKVKKAINKYGNLDYDQWEAERERRREEEEKAKVDLVEKKKPVNDVLVDAAKLFGEIIFDVIGGGIE